MSLGSRRHEKNIPELNQAESEGRIGQGSAGEQACVPPQPSMATVGLLVFFEAVVIYFSSSYRLTVLQSHLSSPALLFHTKLEPICLGKLFFPLYSFYLSLSPSFLPSISLSLFLLLKQNLIHLWSAFALNSWSSCLPPKMLGFRGLGCHTWLSIDFSGV